MSARLVIAIGLNAVLLLAGCEKSPGTAAPAKGPAQPPLNPPAASTPAFLPSRDGFAFANNFPGAPLPTFLNSSGTNDPKSAFGLCGGMAAAAADYFLAGLSAPTQTALPERGSTLYEYLFLRQAQSFGPGIVTALKFAEWTTKSDAELNTLTNGEIEILAKALRERPVVPIGLIIARPGGPPGARNISDNHQVLALAMEKNDGVATIRVYDPNYPKDDNVVIILNLLNTKQPVGIRNRPKGRATAIRGVFVLPYEAAVPPASNSGVPPQ
ncbi:MAG: hypothetical protein J0L78_11150 [Planctomycetes bacterium]|nr:hypothetical protein [Planctomycetota bacterium]